VSSDPEARLTTTSYVVLGLVEAAQPATPYEIKRIHEQSVANFWTLAHTQLYSECTRLAAAGLLDERQEETGRRRKVYRVTQAGAVALDRWRADTAADLIEVRDLGTLKLFFGGSPQGLAEGQLAAHEAKLAEYEALAGQEMPDGMRLALEGGIGHEREFIRFWKSVSRRNGS
jgi:DNA-binding PadR family transcriptional regulator